MKKRILFDFDSTLNNFLEDLLEKYCTLTGESVWAEDIKTYDFDPYVKFPYLLKSIWHDSPTFFLDLSPKDEEFLDEFVFLADEVHIATKCYTPWQEVQKRKWIERCIPHFDMQNFHPIYGSQVKADLIGYDFDFFIDDSPYEVAAYAARHPKTKIFMPRYEYNKDLPYEHFDQLSELTCKFKT